MPTTGLPTQRAKEDHTGRWYAAIFLTLAAIVLLVMGIWQYSTTQTTPAPTTVATVPAQYEGVSLPQAMRLSDATVSGVPARYSGVSVPQAMRLSDATVSGIPAEYAGYSLPQVMRMVDTMR
ncbi:MAG: hypothetical protein GC156_03425 [Actinomycetales bacterium]|nr:hypothetical protein [Actinomycetales bacterium]